MSGELDSKYIIIKAPSLEVANGILHDATVSLGLSEANYEYLVGKRHEGYIFGMVIRNNNQPSQSGEYFLYEFDMYIVAAMNPQITTKVSELTNVWWVAKEEVSNIIPQNEGTV